MPRARLTIAILCSTAVLALAVTGPVSAQVEGKTNQQWFPDLLDLSPLRQDAAKSDPMGGDYDYRRQVETLDVAALKNDIANVLTTSQPWWPSDYGNYGPFFIRMAWHSAGTYRQADGRGGAGGAQQRFEPLNSWPDNVNLDKARRLLWPIKQKYGSKISWSDLMELTGNVALEQMGFKTLGFAFGRRDEWEADQTYWGPETRMLADQRHTAPGVIRKPLAASQMGLIYVNPEGPNGTPDPLAAAKEIRATFGNMGMNDEETVALIAGGHTFGKAHGARPKTCVGAAPSAAGIEKQGLGWENKCGTGTGADAVGSGLEGAWTSEPAKFTHEYLSNLFDNDWVLTKSPAGASQWRPKVLSASTMTPDATDASKKHPLMMFTTDLALKMDPAYRAIALRYRNDPTAFDKAWAAAWFKLIHRDMGPRRFYLGNEIPAQEFSWQDPLPVAPSKVIGDAEVKRIKKMVLDSGVSDAALIRTAWASAASYRKTDMRGGANGGRVRLEPQIHWLANSPQELVAVLQRLAVIRQDFNRNGGPDVSLADVIVLAGDAAIEHAASERGFKVDVPFVAGRVDATQEQTDISGYTAMEPTADGFRNYYDPADRLSPTDALVERAYMLDLSVPEMTVLVGGMRVLSANSGNSSVGVLTNRPGTLSNDFFVNLLDMRTVWAKSTRSPALYEGRDRASGQLRWTASPVDLIFGSNSELRAVAEVYAQDDARQKFVTDFVIAWNKVMNNDLRPR
jgi:catalase-peroxidase